MFGKLIDKLKGRCTAFAIFFALSSTIMAWFKHLDPNYIGAIVAIQGWMVVHSGKEDYFAGPKTPDAVGPMPQGKLL